MGRVHLPPNTSQACRVPSSPPLCLAFDGIRQKIENSINIPTQQCHCYWSDILSRVSWKQLSDLALFHPSNHEHISASVSHVRASHDWADSGATFGWGQMNSEMIIFSCCLRKNVLPRLMLLLRMVLIWATKHVRRLVLVQKPLFLIVVVLTANFTTAVACSHSRSSAAANISASAFASSKSVETISFSTLGMTLRMRFLLSARKTRKITNFMFCHTAVLCWEICNESKMMMAIVLVKSICSWRLHLLSFLTRVLQFFLARPRPRISHLGILKALHRVARHKLTVFKFFRLPKRCNNCLTRF